MLKVTVCITTFNLEQYISKTLDSILHQNTNFDYKIVVADDCSTDNTLNILYKYKRQYKEKIEILTTAKNLGSLANSNRIFENVKTQYLAFIDGDDYWLTNYQLQAQVDFLDSNPNYTICAGNTFYLYESGQKKLVVNKKYLSNSYSFNDYIEGKVPFVHTSSMLLRNVIFCHGIPECYKQAVGTFEECALRGEDFRRILHLQLGKLYIMSDVYSIYRIHKKGLWQGASRTKRAIEGAISANFYCKYFGDKYGNIFKKNLDSSYRWMLITIMLYRSIFKEYNLTKNETYLLTSLFNDLSQNDQKPENNVSNLKVHLYRIAMKLQTIFLNKNTH